MRIFHYIKKPFRFRSYINFFKTRGSPFFHLRKKILQIKKKKIRKSIYQYGLISNFITPDLPPLLKELKDFGFARVPSDFLNQEDLQKIAQETELRMKAIKLQSTEKHPKKFWTRVFLENELCSSNPIVKIALSPKILSLVTAYFRETPFFVSTDFYLSFPLSDDLKYHESQLWHRDYDDTKMLKLFIYFSDVNSDADGPFTFIKANLSDHIKNKIVPNRITDEEMHKQGFADKATKVYGKKFTTFLVDTYRCYHLGSRVEKGHHRLAYNGMFITHAPLWDMKACVKVDSNASPLEKLIFN